jgi:hypothetical protein
MGKTVGKKSGATVSLNGDLSLIRFLKTASQHKNKMYTHWTTALEQWFLIKSIDVV